MKDTSRIYHERAIDGGDWIQKITGIKKENLDVFNDDERKSGTVKEVLEDGWVLIKTDNGTEAISEEPEIEVAIGDVVSFIAVGNAAEDIILVE